MGGVEDVDCDSPTRISGTGRPRKNGPNRKSPSQMYLALDCNHMAEFQDDSGAHTVRSQNSKAEKRTGHGLDVVAS